MDKNIVCELICTRISHDIVGNIGAVSNAVELLEEGDMDFIDDIKSILANSSKTLSARMKFFRLAFGLCNPNLENADMVAQTTQNYLLTLGNKDFPITLNYNVSATEYHRSAMLMVMALADVLIRGGDISVDDSNEVLTCKLNKNSKVSTDKLEKINSILTNGSHNNDAGLAHIVALFGYNSDKKIRLSENGDYIMLIME